MSVDTNYPPGDFADRNGEEFSNVVLAPPDRGSAYDDIFKVSHCVSCVFIRLKVVAGRQREEAQDLNRESCKNVFVGLELDGGNTGAILVKGGSSNNRWDDVLIHPGNSHSDIMVGGYSGQSRKSSVGNKFNNVRRSDGKPVRVAWTFIRAQKPVFTNSNVRYQYGWSLLRTIYTELKYLFK